MLIDLVVFRKQPKHSFLNGFIRRSFAVMFIKGYLSPTETTVFLTLFLEGNINYNDAAAVFSKED